MIPFFLDILPAAISEKVPDFGISKGFLVGSVSWILIVGITIIIAGFGVYYLIRNMKFNQHIEVYKKIGGRYEKVAKDRAMLMRHGEGGDTIFYLKKYKKYLPTPSEQVGRNLYWFAIRKDEEWINFGIRDIDEQMRELNARFLHTEARHARSSLQKGLKERYSKPSFWQTHGTQILMITFVVAVGIMFWLSLDKFIDIAGAVQGIVEQVPELLDRMDDILVSMDRVGSGSGIKPAEIILGLIR